MAITEGSATLPQDTGGHYQWGLTDGTDLYFPRLDNTTAKNQRVALYDAAGNPLLVTDDAAFTPGTSSVMPIGALADETSPDSVDEGDAGILRMTLDRKLRVQGLQDYSLQTYINAYALRVNTQYNGAWLDMQGFSRAGVQVVNGLDQPLTLRISYAFVSDGTNADEWYDSGATVAAAGSVRVWTPANPGGARVTALNAPWAIPYVRFGVISQSGSVPSSGTVTVRVFLLAN